ncbi:hypothetical protein PtA15_18A409 [Puccinia triticina]|uniref:Uncharacterized protein n=1 Tax=Puccinia triticina TaxID=208348 RepID=A0ABY7D6T8_9BASI|nr:uncharacterized protein PtA15_18A409 [Puccinia triticina]WAQ93349.1 hypothetical protein PtA15_18A409 [Puccinia triticina]WAR63349.1 hypothetical protein PtB15_18B432 [Puccinia triticina]
MVSKLLSCLIIAVSYHHVIGPFSAPPVPLNVADILPPSPNHEIPEAFADHKTYYERLTPSEKFLGASEMSEARTASGQPPDEIFPPGTLKNYVATQVTRWILDPTTSYGSLCSDTQTQWKYIGTIFNELDDEGQADVRKYLKDNGVVVSVIDMINVKRLEWFMKRANRPVWWTAHFMPALWFPNRQLVGEDLSLITIGDILQFEKKESDFKSVASFREVTNKFRELDEVFRQHHSIALQRTG